MKRLLAALSLLTACATTAPVIFDISSQRPLRDTHQCVTEQVVDADFSVTETRRDDGVIHAVRYFEETRQVPSTTGNRVVERTMEEWQRIEVLIFERNDGSTSIQYTAASGDTRTGPWTAPSEPMMHLAQQVANACS